MRSDILILHLWTYQQIERDCVGDHQQGHIDDRNRIGSAELPWHHIKASLNRVVIVDGDVGCPHEIQGDNEGPKQRADPCGEKGQNGQHPSCEITVGSERCEASRHTRANDSRKDKDEPEESKAVQRSDGTLGFESVHRLEPGPKVDAETKQPCDVTQNKLNSKEIYWCHFRPPADCRRKIRHSAGRTAPASVGSCGLPCESHRKSDSVLHPSGRSAKDEKDDRAREDRAALSPHSPTARP